MQRIAGGGAAALGLLLVVLSSGCIDVKKNEGGPDAGDADGGAGDGDGDGPIGDGAVGDGAVGDGDGDGDVSPQCTKHEDCNGPGGNLQCTKDGFCVDCINDDGCKGLLLCDVEQNKCVQCLSNAECSSYPTSPHCDLERHACVGCANDGECEPFGLVCDEGLDVDGDGACSECIPGENEEERCANGKACVMPPPWEEDRPESGLYSCSGARRGSLVSCQRCSTSSECEEGSACVSQLYKGYRTGAYCAPIATMGVPCPRTVPAKVKAWKTGGTWAVPGDDWTAPSNGESKQFCVPDETVSSCVAITEFGNACSTGEEAAGACGSVVANGMLGGICVGSPGEKRCTYECKTNADCRTSCVGTDVSYCNPF